MALKEELIKRRLALGMSQTKFAQALDLSPSTVSLWEKGKIKPGVDSIIALAKFFGITEQELLHPKEETEEKEDSKNVL